MFKKSLLAMVLVSMVAFTGCMGGSDKAEDNKTTETNKTAA
jgi:PBP1b-binding outer membrane lipoprotein LpoB